MKLLFTIWLVSLIAVAPGGEEVKADAYFFRKSVTFDDTFPMKDDATDSILQAKVEKMVRYEYYINEETDQVFIETSHFQRAIAPPVVPVTTTETGTTQ